MQWMNAFPENPGLHWQLKLPAVFEQTVFSPHKPKGPFNLSHSFMSMTNNKTIYKNEYNLI